jgi:hypothetical protein
MTPFVGTVPRPDTAFGRKTMLAFWKKKGPQLTREDSLAAVVVPNRQLRVERNAEGVVTLYAPFHAAAFVERIARWLGAPARAGEAKVELDEVGSFVWNLCDGQRNVREMVACLADKYKLNRKEAEASLTAFLRSLAGRNLVAIVILKREKQENERRSG